MPTQFPFGQGGFVASQLDNAPLLDRESLNFTRTSESVGAAKEVTKIFGKMASRKRDRGRRRRLMMFSRAMVYDGGARTRLRVRASPSGGAAAAVR